MNETGIWSSEDALKNGYPKSYSLASKLIDNIFRKNEFVFDFGCGDAFYIYHLKSNGYNVVGFDGYCNTHSLVPIVVKDLSEKFDNPIKGQVLSLEVGEHIPRKFEQTFIDNICTSCNSRMVLSWAIPGQGGTGHVNCQPNDYIIDEVEKRGFKFNSDLTIFLRADIEMHVKYFENTLMVFDKK